MVSGTLERFNQSASDFACVHIYFKKYREAVELQHFKCKMYTYVSQKYYLWNVAKIFIKILETAL